MQHQPVKTMGAKIRLDRQGEEGVHSAKKSQVAVCDERITPSISAAVRLGREEDEIGISVEAASQPCRT